MCCVWVYGWVRVRRRASTLQGTAREMTALGRVGGALGLGSGLGLGLGFGFGLDARPGARWRCAALELGLGLGLGLTLTLILTLTLTPTPTLPLPLPLTRRTGSWGRVGSARDRVAPRRPPASLRG